MSTINLLPSGYLQKARQRTTNLICLGLFGVVVVSIIGAMLVSERSARNTREVCRRINASYADASRLIDEVHQLEAQKSTMLRKAERAASLMERLPRSYVLAMLTNALPPGAALTELDMTVKTIRTAAQRDRASMTKAQKVAAARAGKPVPPPEPPKLAVEFTLKGRATTDVQVARLIANLVRHPLTQMVDLSYSKEADGARRDDDDERVREFQLRVRLKPDADALDVKADEDVADAEPPAQGAPADQGGRA